MAIKSISEELKEMNKNIKDLQSFVNTKKAIKRIHKGNIFNRKFSAILTTFSDFETIAERLEENIINSEILEREIQRRNQIQDKEKITIEGQNLRKKSDKLTKQISVDFRSLYIFSKIFLDEYITLIRFLFDWRGIGEKSITNFYHDLDKYDNPDSQILLFKKTCLNRLKAINIFITGYRDEYIVHDRSKYKDTRWFLQEMQGDVRFLGKRPSITPKEIVFVVGGYVLDTLNFIKTNL